MLIFDINFEISQYFEFFYHSIAHFRAKTATRISITSQTSASLSYPPSACAVWILLKICSLACPFLKYNQLKVCQIWCSSYKETAKTNRSKKRTLCIIIIFNSMRNLNLNLVKIVYFNTTIIPADFKKAPTEGIL